MNKLRNFIYEKNDLIVALLVVLITASILWWKIDGIMEYPKKLVAVTVSDKERNTQPEEVGKTSAVEINITKKEGKHSQYSRRVLAFSCSYSNNHIRQLYYKGYQCHYACSDCYVYRYSSNNSFKL